MKVTLHARFTTVTSKPSDLSLHRGLIEILLTVPLKSCIFRKSSDSQTSTVPRTTQLRRMYTRLITRIETTCTRLGNFVLYTICTVLHSSVFIINSVLELHFCGRKRNFLLSLRYIFARKKYFAKSFSNFILRKIALFRFCVILFCAILRIKFSVKG